MPVGGPGGRVFAVGRWWREGAEGGAGWLRLAWKHRGEQARDGDLPPLHGVVAVIRVASDRLCLPPPEAQADRAGGEEDGQRARLGDSRDVVQNHVLTGKAD